MKSTWAIRDIKHGKTFHFETLEDMINFVEKLKGNDYDNINNRSKTGTS